MIYLPKFVYVDFYNSWNYGYSYFPNPNDMKNLYIFTDRGGDNYILKFRDVYKVNIILRRIYK